MCHFDSSSSFALGGAKARASETIVSTSAGMPGFLAGAAAGRLVLPLDEAAATYVAAFDELAALSLTL